LGTKDGRRGVIPFPAVWIIIGVTLANPWPSAGFRIDLTGLRPAVDRAPIG
jgi:hypothetical protein